jgi:hypothetical protein
MDESRIDQQAREAFRSAAPPVDTDSFCRSLQARLPAIAAKPRRRATRHFVLAVCSTVVVLAAVGAGIYLAAGHSGDHSMIVIGDAPDTGSLTSAQTPSTASTGVDTTESVDTTTVGAAQPLVSEAQVRRAQQVVSQYFSYFMAGKRAEFNKLLAPGIGVKSSDVWGREKEYLKGAGLSAYRLHSWRGIVRAGDWYIGTGLEVPAAIDEWIREDPTKRIAFQTVMEDYSVRSFRLEHQADSDTWLIVPVEELLGEYPANSEVPVVFASEASQVLARQVGDALGKEFPALADAVVCTHGFRDFPGQKLFEAQLGDSLSGPHWVLTVILQKNSASVGGISGSETSPVSLAGSTAGWVKNHAPYNAQVVIRLADGTTVNLSEQALYADGALKNMPLDVDELKAATAVIAEQFGVVEY